MTETWERFEQAARGGNPDGVPVALMVDSAFLPGLFNLNSLDFYLYPRTWLRAYLTLLNRFPDVVFLPGFWSEYGPATEPSAFGAVVQWRHDRPPVLRALDWPVERWGDLPHPDPYTDGLLALALRHTWKLEKEEELPEPYRARFAAARGPLTVAAFLFGTSALISALDTHPHIIEAALDTITDTLLRFLNAQLTCLREPAGVILIEDTIGLLTPAQFDALARPRLARLLNSFDGLIRVLHVVTPCKPLLVEIARLHFEIFHCGYVLNLTDVKKALGPRIAVMGNVAPATILARGTVEQVEAAAKECIARAGQTGGFVLSAGGPIAAGTPPAHLEALVRAANLP